VVVIFLIALISSMSSAAPDMILNVCVKESARMDDELFTKLCDTANEYVVDTDADGVKYMDPSQIVLVANPTTSGERRAYATFDAAIKDRRVAFFIVDNFAYNYLMEKNVLRPLAFFGIKSPEEYRLRINGTKLLAEGDTDIDYYIVMKYFADSEYTEMFLSSVAAMVVDMVMDIVR